jgi:hypothetical protein
MYTCAYRVCLDTSACYMQVMLTKCINAITYIRSLNHGCIYTQYRVYVYVDSHAYTRGIGTHRAQNKKRHSVSATFAICALCIFGHMRLTRMMENLFAIVIVAAYAIPKDATHKWRNSRNIQKTFVMGVIIFFWQIQGNLCTTSGHTWEYTWIQWHVCFMGAHGVLRTALPASTAERGWVVTVWFNNKGGSMTWREFHGLRRDHWTQWMACVRLLYAPACLGVGSSSGVGLEHHLKQKKRKPTHSQHKTSTALPRHAWCVSQNLCDGPWLELCRKAPGYTYKHDQALQDVCMFMSIVPSVSLCHGDNNLRQIQSHSSKHQICRHSMCTSHLEEAHNACATSASVLKCYINPLKRRKSWDSAGDGSSLL